MSTTDFMKNRIGSRILVPLLLALLLPGLSAAQERAILQDGTIITGKLIRVSGDTLFFKTSFIDELPVERDIFLSIQFGDQAKSGTTPSLESPEGAGRLLVIITGQDITTSIRFRRSDDRRIAEEANRIFFRITANGRVIYEKMDDETDDEVRSEGWTILKNKLHFGRFDVPLPAGA